MKTDLPPPRDPAVVNGKRYSLWPQFVARKSEFIGGILEDLNDGPGCPASTVITDITFEPNGKDSAMFGVDGKEFGCCCDVRYLAVDPSSSDKDWLCFVGYGGHKWRIRKPEAAEITVSA